MIRFFFCLSYVSHKYLYESSFFFPFYMCLCVNIVTKWRRRRMCKKDVLFFLYRSFKIYKYKIYDLIYVFLFNASLSQLYAEKK